MNNHNPEGDDTGYGQALYPVPAEDPNDPLQVCGPFSIESSVVAMPD
jgi:hypothetical protein